MAQKLNVTVRTVYRDLKTLNIKWSGSAKTGHWVFEK
ncbi:MAG: HTH domain-containing protein [Bacteroidales bacterium]|nr:HTH domain-containing protein [Bacteroidales bacterium]